MRRSSSFSVALSCLLALPMIAMPYASAFVRPPTRLEAASLRRQPHTISKIFEPSPFTRLRDPAAAAAAPIVPAGASGNGLVSRLKSMAKNVVTGLPVVALSTISGGFLAGSLHSVTGPDHLAALLPRCIGKRWYQALRIGAVWGLGHGISAIIMGMVAFFLKGRLSSYSHSTLIPKLSLYTEVLIGVSLIIIGLLGLKEAASFEAPAVVTELDETTAVASSSGTLKKEASSKAIFLNGLLHGFSWDGTPTLAPALAFDSWFPVITFLCSYGLGTMLSMSTATCLIGEGTIKVGQAFDRPNIPKTLAQGSSVVAIIVGMVWTFKGLV